MNRLSLTTRLISAATAVAITFALLDAVVSIAAPQRAVLIAKAQRLHSPTQVNTVVAVALNNGTDAGK